MNEPAAGRTRTIERLQLDCGSPLLVIRNPALPLVSIRLQIDAGHLVEAPGEDGILTLAGRLLLSGGAGDRSGAEIFATLEGAGIRYSAASTGLRCDTMTEALPLALDALAAGARRPRFDEDRFAVEHGRLLSELFAAEGNPQIAAFQNLSRIVYGESHPGGRPPTGTPDVVQGFTRDLVAAAFARHAGPSRCIFSVAGDVEPEGIAAELNARFGDWDAEPGERPALPPLELHTPGEELLVEFDKEQLHLYMGHLGIRRSDEDFYSLLVMDHVFGSGSGFTDRLSKKVRDEMGLAYSVGASITQTAGIEPGTFAVYVGTFPDKLEEVTAAVRAEIDNLRVDGVTQEEVDAARRYLRGRFLFDTETNGQLADLAAAVQRLDLGLDFPVTHLEHLDAVTAGDVERVARERLHPESLVTVAAGRRTE